MRIVNRFCLLLIIMTAMLSHVSAAASEKDLPRIARWYGGKAAAVSLRFDDNLKSHLYKAIPLMNLFGIRGTFMVSPGRSSFKKHQEYWLKEVPAMGHELGNHTMHHRGAKSPSEAEKEIGEAARILRKTSGNPERLLVFASGGEKRWGGKRWSDADEAYHKIFESYNMIDLYDGRHPYINVVKGLTPDELINYVDSAAREGRHQAFTFHSVGAPTLRDLVRRLIKGVNLSYPEADFRQFMKMLKDRSNRIWIAPLGDILKYQTQYASARLEGIQYHKDGIGFQLIVDTDPILYDQPLTVVLPMLDVTSVRILQDEKELEIKYDQEGRVSFDLAPVTSFIQVDLIPGALTRLAD
jgi:peptidoglycan/xylan/chitin deacetylase (PgdA/CDA1 family)